MEPNEINTKEECTCSCGINDFDAEMQIRWLKNDLKNSVQMRREQEEFLEASCNENNVLLDILTRTNRKRQDEVSEHKRTEQYLNEHREVVRRIYRLCENAIEDNKVDGDDGSHEKVVRFAKEIKTIIQENL